MLRTRKNLVLKMVHNVVNATGYAEDAENEEQNNADSARTRLLSFQRKPVYHCAMDQTDDSKHDPQRIRDRFCIHEDGYAVRNYKDARYARQNPSRG